MKLLKRVECLLLVCVLVLLWLPMQALAEETTDGIKPESFSLDRHYITGYVDLTLGNLGLPYSFEPSGSSEAVTMVSSDPSVAEVIYDATNNSWRLDYHKLGTAVITATTASGLTDRCTVVVKEEETVTLDKPFTVTVESGDTLQYIFFPEEGGYYSFFSDDGTGYVKINRKDIYYYFLGIHTSEIIAASTMEYLLVCNMGDTAETYTLCLKKTVPIEKVTFEQESYQGSTGDLVYVCCEKYPLWSFDETCTMSSSDETVAYFESDDAGYQKYLVLSSPGIATITATLENGLTATCEVTVVDSHSCVDENYDCACDICQKAYHFFSQESNETGHRFVCSYCNEILPWETHYDNDNDGMCDVCFWGCKHSDLTWSYSQYGHNSFCNVCGKPVTEFADHTMQDGTCAICGYTPCTSDHAFGTDGFLKHICQLCGFISSCVDNDYDCICDICDNEYHNTTDGYDRRYHWATCDVCKKNVSKEMHVDVDNDSICDYCEADLSEESPEDTQYEVIEGDNATVTVGEGEEVAVRIDCLFEKFDNYVTVDGIEVSSDYYTAVAGSTIITLTPEYLETLEVGWHTLGVKFTDGEAHANFEIQEKTQFVSGDINGDGKVNGKDGILLAQYLAEWDVAINMDAADVNGDGEVNGKDGILLAQYLAEWDVTLG